MTNSLIANDLIYFLAFHLLSRLLLANFIFSFKVRLNAKACLEYLFLHNVLIEEWLVLFTVILWPSLAPILALCGNILSTNWPLVMANKNGDFLSKTWRFNVGTILAPPTSLWLRVGALIVEHLREMFHFNCMHRFSCTNTCCVLDYYSMKFTFFPKKL